MSDRVLQVGVRRGVATVTLDSPANRNALSHTMRVQLRSALTEAIADDSVRVVVLDHTGRVFCSGMDLAEAAGGAAQDQGVNEFPALLEMVWNSPKPVVGVVRGPARAGGVGLLAACDVVVAAEAATFAFTEVRIGIVPAEDVDACVAAQVEALGKGAPLALAETKRLLRAARTGPLAEQFPDLLDLSARFFASEEGQEGIAAFREKRPARWVPA